MSNNLDSYMTVNEAAEKWGLSVRWVHSLVQADKVEGAIRKGNMILIPATNEKPVDGRIKTGEYIGWRKSYSGESK